MSTPSTTGEDAAPWWMRDVWAPDAEPAAWATPTLNIWIDGIARRRQALEAVLAWPDGWRLWVDAYLEIDQLDAEFDAWWQACQVRIAAHASWPT